MMGINIDLGDLKDLMDLKEPTQKVLHDAARDLAVMTHAKIVEIANAKLHSRREMYVTGLHYGKVSDDVWVVSLAAAVRWIDDGQRPHSQLDDLLKSPKAKVSKKDGSKYIVVPFNHGPGKGATNSTKAQQDLVSTLKTEMKARGIPFGKIEKGADGNAKVGRLHSFNIGDAPVKTQHGPGQGHGPVGEVRQGPNDRQAVGGGPSGGGRPFLHGVSVYQTKDPAARSGVKRSIMTFRIASSKHKAEGTRWNHPGTEPIHIMEDGFKWALEEWQSKIAPDIVSRIIAKIG